ncbi:hypothetical protein [Cognatazoarcus halotolerans]|uniref:hypothetical protein n=1 Tax=Cognatazoarcus halotolerans TaxID=2686016 RepID=UPI00190F4FFA|nr:hypothetical protein [Cognatazoarcus halotolerans]MBX3680040.1 hypothetical protein [Rhodocyclaceae bacterium]MCB1902009.1 hypothetical protein [Rhodocyclaceae bacterium]MCP5309778.1 hypothetical protein [Zoogloeaceae bacterium]
MGWILFGVTANIVVFSPYPRTCSVRGYAVVHHTEICGHRTARDNPDLPSEQAIEKKQKTKNTPEPEGWFAARESGARR